MSAAFEILLCVESALLGALAMSRSARFATLLGLPLLGLVLLKLAASNVPAAEPRLFPWDWYPFVETWWYLVPAMFLFGAGAWAARTSIWKRDVLLVLGGLLTLRTGVLSWESRGGRHGGLRGTVDETGVCLQTSGYSCAPAAAVSFLHRYGVRATEREMAVVCATRPGFGGTSECGIMHGLRKKLPGRLVRIAAPRYEDLPQPSLVSFRLTWLVGHSVLLEEAGPDIVHLVDPMYGRMTLSRKEFEERWKGSAIYVAR